MARGDLLGEFELYVLAALEHLGGDAYGVTVRDTIEERSGRMTSFGAVYATMERLADKGYVSFWFAPPDASSGGRSRKCIRVTPGGHRVFIESVGALNRMLAGLSVGLALQSPR